MKIKIIKDASGNVVGTLESAVADGPTIAPVLKPGHTLQEVECADNYHEEIVAFYELHSRKSIAANN